MVNENPAGSALAQKLDEQLDEHIDAMLEKNEGYRYKDGLTEENWEEEIKKIPLFSNEISQEDIDESTELQALQALKYECESPRLSAIALKEDGNHNFQKKRYKQAITVYTEALKEKHDDFLVYATLYTNRAAANFHLGNNRTALNDAMRALHYKPEHMKGILRCAICSFDLERYDDCVTWCERGLAVEANEAKLLELARKAKYQQKQQERDLRKEENKKIRDLTKRNKLVDALDKRNINIESLTGAKTSKRTNLEKLISDGCGAHSRKIHLGENDVIHWPVYFLYPESNQSDFIEDFNETHTFEQHLRIVFEVLPDWDTERKYTHENAEVYFEDKTQNRMIHVDRKLTLRRVLSDERYLLRGGCPAFLILSKSTDFYKNYTAVQDAEEFEN